MTETQYVGLCSAVFGAVGTIIMFLNSYSIQPQAGGVFGGPLVTEYNNGVRAKNARRIVWQRIGLGFLCFSFTVQAVAVFLIKDHT